MRFSHLDGSSSLHMSLCRISKVILVLSSRLVALWYLSFCAPTISCGNQLVRKSSSGCHSSPHSVPQPLVFTRTFELSAETHPKSFVTWMAESIAVRRCFVPFEDEPGVKKHPHKKNYVASPCVSASHTCNHKQVTHTNTCTHHPRPQRMSISSTLSTISPRGEA